MSAEECLRLGIANRVVPFSDLQVATTELASQIANGPATALRYMKENLNRAITQDLKSCLALEADRMVRCTKTADHSEAVRAFMEKRPPAFDHSA